MESNKNELLNKGCAVVNKLMDCCEQWQLSRALELMVLVALCFGAGRILSNLIGWGNAEFSGFWVIMSALLVSKEQPDLKLIDIIQWRLMAVALGVGAAFVVLSVFGVNYCGLLIAVLLVAWLCEFFKWQRHQQLALISLSVLVVSNYLQVDNALWASAVGRILEAAIGMCLAYGVHMGFTCCKEGCNKPY
ncbi:MAG: FUSC family protein [Gammaproteobacteria bacterium]|nr:FUSC family protein [Gammaproteobacteria bacterium]